MNETLEYIDSYFKGDPPPSESVQFEKRILEDPVFADEVAFYLSSVQAARDQLTDDKKARFRELYRLAGAERFGMGTRSSGPGSRSSAPVRKLWAWASVAALVAAIVAGWWLFLKPADPRELADRYVRQEWEHPGLKMSAIADSMQKALRLYYDHKFVEARSAFEKMAASDSTNIDAERYAGIVSFRLGDYDKAIAWFGLLGEDKELYANPGKFFKAITLMERNRPGDKEQAHTLLQEVVEKDLEGKEYARKWVKDF